MKGLIIVVAAVVVIIVAFLIWLAASYNGFVKLRNKTEEA